MTNRGLCDIAGSGGNGSGARSVALLYLGAWLRMQTAKTKPSCQGVSESWGLLSSFQRSWRFLSLVRTMPTISAFYGILIKMFFNDHAPPHFHAEYAEFKATVDIKTLQVLEGQ